MPEASRARSALLSRRCILLTPALATVFSGSAQALSYIYDPWAFSQDVKSISVSPRVLVQKGQGWYLLRSGQSYIGGDTPRLASGGILRPELGDGLPQRAAEVAATTLHRNANKRPPYDSSGRPAERAPLPRVVFPDNRESLDLSAHLSVGVTLYVQDIADELPQPAPPRVRFLAILDQASQGRRVKNELQGRTLTPRVVHRTVTPDTIEDHLLRRFDEVIEKAVLFPGWDGP